MRFGPVPVAEAEGAILAHSQTVAHGRLRKGLVLAAADIAALAAAGFAEVTVARVEPGDLAEDAAATEITAALATGSGLTVTPPANGRVNLRAPAPGLVAVDARSVHALNRIDPGITLATLPDLARVGAGTLCATVKIIAYAVPAAAVAAAVAAAAGALRFLPVRRQSAGLILTVVPGQEPKLNAKGRKAMEGRLRALGMALAGVETVAHAEGAVAGALARLPGDMALILTGSATSDLHDTAPQAVRAAGGTVARFGMPVDPGNLLFLGELAGRPVIGLPGCARSPALNGADWVLERLACGIDVTADDIAAMGVGGLLKEIPSRGQPREA
jgi:molybdenum cofactor cytidylyltransferase